MKRMASILTSVTRHTSSGTASPLEEKHRKHRATMWGKAAYSGSVVLFRLSPEVYRHHKEAGSYRPTPLLALRAMCENLPQTGYRKEGLTMNHREKRQFLIQALLKERPEYRDMRIPTEPAPAFAGTDEYSCAPAYGCGGSENSGRISAS